MNVSSNISISRTVKNQSIVFKSFMFAGLGFLIITLMGLASYLYVSSEGLLKGIANEKSFAIYGKLSQVGSSEAIKRLVYLSFGSLIFIVISSIMSIIWSFRVFKASKTFIYSTWSIYSIAQGLAFGILFSTWNTIELLGIFGMAAILFASFGGIGYFLFKKNVNLLGWGKMLFILVLITIGLVVINSIFYATNVLIGSKLTFIINILFGILISCYTIYDVWSLMKFAEMHNEQFDNDKEMTFRITAWFSFRLLTDFIAIIWYLVRLYFYFRG